MNNHLVSVKDFEGEVTEIKKDLASCYGEEIDKKLTLVIEVPTLENVFSLRGVYFVYSRGKIKYSGGNFKKAITMYNGVD